MVNDSLNCAQSELGLKWIAMIEGLRRNMRPGRVKFVIIGYQVGQNWGANIVAKNSASPFRTYEVLRTILLV